MGQVLIDGVALPEDGPNPPQPVDGLEKDSAGNVAVGDAIGEQCRDTYVLASSRTVAAVGLQNLVVVETPDAVLVIARDSAQSVKKVVDRLKARG